MDSDNIPDSDIQLWGDSQIADAVVVAENWYGDNERLPQTGTILHFLPEHGIEYQKCKESIHYFAENYYTITVGGNKKEVMKLWDIQKRALDFFKANNRVVMNSSRQTSKTTLVVLFVLWNLIFGEGQQNIGLLGNKFDLAKLNLDKVKEAYENLPLFLKPLIDRWNEKKILFINGNECKITSTSSDSFRGSTLTSLVIDECAFVNEGGKKDLDKDILQSLLPTLDAMGLGETPDNSFCILVSTPYGMNNEFARQYHKARAYEDEGFPEVDESDPNAKESKNATNFRAFEMLWSDHPLRDDRWFRKKIVEMGSEEAFYVEFGGSFTMGDGAKRAIDNDVKEFQKDNNISKPIFTQTKLLDIDNDIDDDSLKIWEFPDRDRIYIAGVDIAEGTENCFSTVQVLDITDLGDIKQVAEYRNNTISVTEFPLVCLRIFNAYNQCFASIEHNSSGREVISSLVNAHGYTKLVRYHTNTEGLKRMVKNGEFGIVSHNSSKNKAVSNMRHFLNTVRCITLRSDTLLRELDGFIQVMGKNNNWKWGKQGGSDSYDDTVDAFFWALLPLHAQLVETYYNIDEFNKYSKPINILSEVYTHTDHRKDNARMPINSSKIRTSIYTNDGSITDYNGNEVIGEQPFDIEWLQNF